MRINNEDPQLVFALSAQIRAILGKNPVFPGRRRPRSADLREL